MLSRLGRVHIRRYRTTLVPDTLPNREAWKKLNIIRASVSLEGLPAKGKT